MSGSFREEKKRNVLAYTDSMLTQGVQKLPEQRRVSAWLL